MPRSASAIIRLSYGREVKEAGFPVTDVRHGCLRQSRRCTVLIAAKFAFSLPLHGRQHETSDLGRWSTARVGAL
jgi:hypothetical protein